MDQYFEEMRALIPERSLSLREERYDIDARKLAVVAVLQDIDSKRVLQSVYLDAVK